MKYKWRIFQRGIEFIPAELTFLSQLYFNDEIYYGKKSGINLLLYMKKYLQMMKCIQYYYLYNMLLPNNTFDPT